MTSNDTSTFGGRLLIGATGSAAIASRAAVVSSAMALLAALGQEGTVALSPAELSLLREWLNRLADAGDVGDVDG
ncbi:hypothetical protein ACFW6E_44020 [Streptomyces olivaceoviridis]|uniref:hypothetical protein n=1 Tax=Streptomyces olivaceoviridis TaxID=1921 RepID=UPI0036905829